MKILKRVLIGFAIFVLTIFLLLLVTPVLFKGKIFEIAKRELNNMLTAQVDFSDLKLSFIRNFPNAYVALEDLSVTGTDEFEGVTLAAFKRLSVTVDIMSVIRMNNIQVKSVLLDQAVANAVILEDGKANWDIMKTSDTQETAPTEVTEKEDAPSSTSTLGIALNKFEIRNANLSFKDESSNMEATVTDLNFFLRGDMTLDNVDLSMNLNIAEVNFWLDGIRLLNSAQVGFDSQIEADLKNMAFTFKDNQFNLNEIILKFAGFVQLPDDGINMDVSFATEKTDFKSLLSLVPAIYMQDFESIQTTGSLTLSGDVKGTFNDEKLPKANVNLTVDNAMFKYPDLPKSVDNINIALKAFFDGEVIDNTTLDLDRFSFRMADNPFSAELHVKTPESDMQVAAKFAGRIDFNSIADIIPLEGISLKGLFECDLSLAGRLSTFETGHYENFDARGMLKISDFDFRSQDFPIDILIKSTLLNFTPRIVELANLDVVAGNTDIALNGSLENFIPFIFRGDTVKGNLNLRSNNIDVNEFMALIPETETPETPVEKPAESAPLSVIEVPKNIDFTMNVNIGRILFDKLNISNTAGVLLVRDGKVQMQNLGMNLLEGSMVLNGEYNTQDIKVPLIDFAMDIRQFDITSALSSFSMLEQILPDPQNYVGKVSANLTLFSILDEQLSPVLDSVESKGQLQTHNIEIHNSPIFGSLADLLKNEAWRNPAPGNLNIRFEIKDGRLHVEPILFNIAQVRLNLSGDQGLDMSLNYRVNAAVPVSSIGSGATDLLGRIPGGSNVRELTVTGLVTGTASNPHVSLSAADMAGNILDSARSQVTETVTERVDETMQQLRAERDKQVAAIMEEAEKQAENIRHVAKQSADRLRDEANTAADRLESEARTRSVVEQALAKTAADRLRSEGEASAVRVEQEAERQIASVMQAARERAEQISN